MNFLAHAYLSGDNEKWLVGNFIADFVKGKSALQKFDEPVRQGIMLHRAIDAFTDTHPVVSASKSRLREKYRHYSGVIVDVFYDYFLATQWTNFHRLSLSDFADDVYAVINANYPMLPEKVQQFFPYMQRGNWLLNYARVEGISRALTGMSRRTPYVSHMDEATTELIKFSREFESEFNEFFPQLKAHVDLYQQQLRDSHGIS